MKRILMTDHAQIMVTVLCKLINYLNYLTKMRNYFLKQKKKLEIIILNLRYIYLNKLFII